MIKNIKISIIFILSFLISGCFGTGINTNGYKIGKDYQLYRTSNHIVGIAPIGGWSSDEEIIPAKVVEIAWNDEYIIAKQYDLKDENDYNGYKIPDETKENYWILNMEERKRIGPLSKEEFSDKLFELELSGLKLKDVEIYWEKDDALEN